MAIDRGGTWWTGEDLGDLAECLREYTADAFSADEVRECRCGPSALR
jgi:hypothetical protein